jgi:hypothetical protein
MTGELHRGEAPRRLSDITNTSPGPSQGGSFTFDEATMQSLVNDWLDLMNEYDDSTRAAEQMARVDPPGLEYASEGVASAARTSADAYMAYLEHNRDYCKAQAQLFQNALDDYRGVERTNVEELSNAGPGGDGTVV